ncbi:MAG: hypothetical protein A2521_04230 [Deltaproteobacteria bacterium RIFOXYD12_FULL_57_12]|nr:MAG: hypothetical protein A2521_04230 [Deltaproteobacteria bacterium RIFOXYD12_FULL_57_12]
MSQAPLGSPSQPGNKNSPENMRKVCQQFEAIFIQTLFKGMRATVPDGGLLEKDISSEIFQEMMDQEVARMQSQSQGVGIADALYRQLQKNPR